MAAAAAPVAALVAEAAAAAREEVVWTELGVGLRGAEWLLLAAVQGADGGSRGAARTTSELLDSVGRSCIVATYTVTHALILP